MPVYLFLLVGDVSMVMQEMTMWFWRLIYTAALVFFVIGCATLPPTPTPVLVPTIVPSTPTPVVLPTAIDTFFGEPAVYSHTVGNRTQTIRLGVSPDFATRPVLPFYALTLSDPKFANRLLEAVSYNHFFRWQESDWANRSSVLYDDFKKRVAAGEDMSYPAMDTRAGGAGAHVAKVNPAADMDILMIPRHDGFVTFPGSQSDPGLSVKNKINADGSVTVHVPLVYAQVISYKAGDPAIQNLARTAIVLALMEMGIPSDAIEKKDLPAIATWWETQPEKDLHRFQYSYLQKLLTEPEGDKSILYLVDVK